MATVNIKFFRPAVIPGAGAAMGQDVATAEVFTSSGTTQPTTASAPDNNTYVRIASSGGNVYVAFGTAPTAVTGEGTLILDGVPEYFKLEAGHKVALID
jgi:hypothetical protein